MFRFLPVIVLLLIPTLARAQEFGNSCPFRPLPLVRVEIRAREPVILHDKTRQQLTSMPNNTHLRLGGPEAVGGLTSNPIDARAEMSFDSQTSFLGGEGCLWLTTLTIHLTMTPEINIARDWPEGSCIWRALLDHERRHVAADQDLLSRFKTRIEPKFSDLAREMAVQGPIPTSIMYTAQSTASSRINLRLQSEMIWFGQERDRIQQAIDSPQEYRALASQCADSMPHGVAP